MKTAPRRSRGITLIELLATIVVMSTVTAVVIPMLDDGAGARLSAALTVLKDDLEQARHRTVTDPDRPVILVLDEDGRGWTLAEEPTGAPIVRHDGRPWSVRFGEGMATSLHDLRVEREDGGDRVAFDGEGVVLEDAPPRLTIASPDRRRTIEVGLVSGLIRPLPESTTGG